MSMSSMKPAEWGMLILLSIFWGGSFFFVEIALHDFQPFTLVFLRVTLAALILIGVVYIGGQRMPASLRVWGAFLVMGALNNDGRVLKWIKNWCNFKQKVDCHYDN